MSSSVTVLALTTTQFTTYFGLIIFIGGTLGGLLNIIVFLSLRTFRQNSCAFYLMISSVVNIGQLWTGLLSRILISALNVDWTIISPIYCKLRAYLIQVFTLISLTTVCLATMDQFFATSGSLRWRQWSHIKVAYKLSAGFILFWTIYFIPYLIFYNVFTVLPSGIKTCGITNYIFSLYTQKFYIPVLFGPLPLLITSIFALLAYRNIKQLAHRTVPLVRRELDKQMTIIVLAQVTFNVITILPCVILLIHSGYITPTDEFQFILALFICIYYLYCVSPFYINMCASKRFRRQLSYVLIDIHLNRWRHRQVDPTQ